MQIEDMTEEQILQHLQERKTRKGELGGQLMRADDVPVGQTVWIKCVKQQTGNAGSLFSYEVGDESEDIRIYNKALVETNVPERTAFRRHMVAGEAVEQLQVGDRVWVRGTVRLINKGEYYEISVVFECGETLWCEREQQIEVEV